MGSDDRQPQTEETKGEQTEAKIVTAAEIEAIADIFGNGCDEQPWAEMESHYDAEERSDLPAWHVYVADGQLLAVFPGGDEWASGPGHAEAAARACCKVAQAIRQLMALLQSRPSAEGICELLMAADAAGAELLPWIKEIAEIADLDSVTLTEHPFESGQDTVKRVTRLRREWEEMHEIIDGCVLALWTTPPENLDDKDVILNRLHSELARLEGESQGATYVAVIERVVGEVSIRYEYEAPTPEAVIDGLFAVVARDGDDDEEAQPDKVSARLHLATNRIDELDTALRKICDVAGDAIPESQVLIPDLVVDLIRVMARGQECDGKRIQRLTQDQRADVARIRHLEGKVAELTARRDELTGLVGVEVLDLAKERDDARKERAEAQAIQAELAEIFDEHGTPMEEGCTLPGLLKNLFAAEHEQADIANAEAGEASDIHDALVEANIPVWEEGFSLLDGIALLVKRNEEALRERDDARDGHVGQIQGGD